MTAPARPGIAMAEAVVALVLTSFIAAIASGLFIAQSRLAVHAADAIESLDAVRTAAALLPLEARAFAAADLHSVSADSAAFRAMRGAGIVCDTAGAITLRYRGLRDPDPAKDSVLIVSDSADRAAALASVATPVAPSCTAGSGERLHAIALAGDSLTPADVVLVFEPGAYHLSGGALRYRAPGGTRQPITADVLAPGGFGLLMRSGGPPPEPLALDMALLPVPRRANAVPAAAQRIRVWLLNTTAPPDST